MARKCPQCKTTKFHKNDEGQLVCLYGHVQGDYRQEAQEDDGHVQVGRRIHVKKQRRVMTDEERDALEQLPDYHELVHSSDWAFLHFEAMQIVLQSQIHACISLGLPTEFRQVVKRFWILFVNKLDVKLVQAKKPLTKNVIPVTEEQAARQVMESVPREFQPMTESESDVGPVPGQKSKKRKALEKRHGLHLGQTLVLLYLSAVHLRLPYLLADFQSWAAQGKIPYMTAGRELPEAMQERLYIHTSTFMPCGVPNMDLLYLECKKMMHFLNRHYDIQFPPANLPLLTARFVKYFSLPDEAVISTLRLCQIMEFTGRHAFTAKRRQLIQPFWNADVSLILYCVIVADAFVRTGKVGNVETWKRKVFDHADRDSNYHHQPDLEKLMAWANAHEQEYLNLLANHVFEKSQQPIVAEFDTIYPRIDTEINSEPISPQDLHNVTSFDLLFSSACQVVNLDKEIVKPMMNNLLHRLEVEHGWMKNFQ